MFINKQRQISDKHLCTSHFSFKLSLEIPHCLLQGPHVGTEMSFSVALVELIDDIIGEVWSLKYSFLNENLAIK